MLLVTLRGFMGGEGCPHRLGIGLPPTGRTLNIDEQKRHHPRRSSRPISGHPRRISQTRAYLVHRRNTAPDELGGADIQSPFRNLPNAHMNFLTLSVVFLDTRRCGQDA